MNTLRTILLIGVLTGLMVAVGAAIGGKSGLMIAFFIACVMNLGSYWFSDKIALAMSRAQPVTREEAPELYAIVEELSEKADIPTPRIYMVEDPSPNAFATGRNPENSAIACTTGIMRLMNRDQLRGVLAHELSHVKNRDVLITSMAAVLASVITMLARMAMFMGGPRDDRDGGGTNPIFVILLAFLAPFAAMLINLAISRSREYQADASGARLCGEPEELASALAKLDQASQAIPMRDVNPAMSSLYIVKPNPNSWFVNLMSTHPPIADRIKRLETVDLTPGNDSVKTQGN
jgi:heat shock protein HtpX